MFVFLWFSPLCCVFELVLSGVLCGGFLLFLVLSKRRVQGMCSTLFNRRVQEACSANVSKKCT